jgi:transposase
MNRSNLCNLYVEQDLSQRGVAKALGCSTSNVRYWLSKYGIRKNTKRQYDDQGSEKTCPKCKSCLPLSQFYKRKNNTPGSWCKRCMAEQVVERQHRYKSDAVSYRGGACVSCGFRHYHGALEFHHLDPSKKETRISKLTQSPLSAEGLAELDKCALLCANCHRMAHAGLVTFHEDGSLKESPYQG